jgi:Ca-activated chloride channel family protein
VLALYLLVRALIHRQQNRYHHEALAELVRLEAAPASAQGEVLTALAELLKRTAMTAYTRARVAELGGDEWFASLDRTGATNFSDGLGAALDDANYRPHTAAWDDEQTRKLASEIRHWIRRHITAEKLATLDAQHPGDTPVATTRARAA